MSSAWTIGAQLSTSHSAPDALTLDGMVTTADRARGIIDLEILVVGTREIPEIFKAFTGARRTAKQTFLWYDLLSDVAGMEESDLVVNWRGERSRGWRGWVKTGNEVAETFRFACPNNPSVRRKTLDRLRELLSRYAFDGVFLDKIRFPSPANGLDEVASCFCEHCRASAAREGLDVDAVAELVGTAGAIAYTAVRTADAGQKQNWLVAIAHAHPLLERFLRFRMNSVTRIIAEAKAEAERLGRRISLDLFSPGLAPLVGQDYGALSRLTKWAKPMTYRFANGPAGLRLEVPALADGVSTMFGLSQQVINEWASAHVPGFTSDTLAAARSGSVPVELVTAEVSAAVQAMGKVPVYFGLELVRHPGVIDIAPESVHETVAAARAGGAAGTIISWDLMHVPEENLRALAAASA